MKKKSRDYRKFTRSLKRFDKFCGKSLEREPFIIPESYWDGGGAKQILKDVIETINNDLAFESYRGLFKFDKK